MKRLAALILLAVALLLALLVSLPLTERGTALLAALATRYSPLALDYGGGRLLGQLQLHRVQLALDSLQLELEEVTLDLDPSCLWQSEFCLRQLEVGELHLTVPAGAGDASAAPPAERERASLALPLRLHAPRVSIGRGEIRWAGGRYLQQAASLGLEVGPEGIQISPARIDEPRLELEPSAQTAPELVQLPEIWLPFALSVEALVLNRPGWELGGNTGQIERLEASLHWQGTQLAVSRLAATRPGWGEVSLAGSLDFEGDWPLSLDANGEAAGQVQWRSLRPGPLSLQARGDLADLELALHSAGEKAVSLRGRLDALDPNLPFSAEVSLDAPGPFALSDLAPLPADFPPVQLSPPLAARVEGDLASQSVSARASASGLGYAALVLALDLVHEGNTVQVQRLELEDAGTGSALSASGAVELGEPLSTDLALRSPGMALPAFSEHLFGRVSGKLGLAARLAGERWSAELRELDLEGEVNGLPASAEGALALDSQHYLAGGDLRFEVNGARGQLGEATDGTGTVLELEVADLSRWQQDSRGRFTARATLGASSQQLRFEAALEDAGFSAWHLRRARAAGEVALDAPAQLRLALHATGLGQEALQLEAVDLELTGDKAERRARLDLAGDIQGRLDLAARREGRGWRGSLQPATLVSPLGPWRLDEAVAFDWRDTRQQLVVTDHCWRGERASLCLSGAELGQSGQAQLALQGSLDVLAPLVTTEADLEGELRGQANARWATGGALQARAELTTGEGAVVQHLREGEPAIWHWDGLQLTAALDQGALAVDGTLQRAGRPLLQLAAALPADRSQPLSGQLEVSNLELAAARPFIPSLSRLDGYLDGTLVLEGTPAAPQARGRLTWREGALAVYTSPTELTDLKLVLDLRGDTLLLDGAGMLGGGQVNVNGELLVRPDWALDLDVQGERSRLLYPPSVEVVVSPDLRVQAGPGRVAVRGDIRVLDGLVHQEELPEGSIELSRDVVQVDYAGNVIEGEQALATSMNLRVAIADRFRVQGGGLDARVGGDLRLQQQPGRPLQLYGNLKVVGGEFNAYGQHLTIEQGRISFAGVPENPELDLRAVREIPLEQVTAGVRVSGTLESPLIDVYTDPPMPQTEALSYLVRGRGLDTGSGTDGAALALSLGTSLVNRSAVVEGLNRVPGLSQVEFGAEGTADETAATVSGYIGERIYLSYGVGLYEPVNVLTARLYLQTRLWLEVVSRLESSVDLYYSFDID